MRPALRVKGWPDEPEIRSICRLADPQMRLCLLLMSDAGCRLREALSFRLEPDPARMPHTHPATPDLHLLRIWAPKTRSWRTVGIPTRLRSSIREAQLPHLASLSPRWVQRRLNELAQAAKAPRTSPHRWRHSFATRLAAAAVPAHTIQALLGHRNLATTMIYLHSSGDQILAAAATLDRLAWLKRSPIMTSAERDLRHALEALRLQVSSLSAQVAVITARPLASKRSIVVQPTRKR